eukprot:Nitzschia sp. Nitz4//scaffold64_size103689//62623//65289//NITZ4_004439-RA/size103689-processed-gene-0.82-mRNA-1//1//CDS//3329556139//3557//frame0
MGPILSQSLPEESLDNDDNVDSTTSPAPIHMESPIEPNPTCSSLPSSSSSTTRATTPPREAQAPPMATQNENFLAAVATTVATPPAVPKSISSVSPSPLIPKPSTASSREGSISVTPPRANTASTIPAMPAVPSGAHNRIGSHDGSYAILSMEAADLLQASWTNSSNQDDPLSYGSSFPKPITVSRLNSTASNRSNTSGPGGILVHSNSLEAETSGVSSAIHDAARITDWKTVKELCEKDAEAAKFVGRDRWTALHHACNRRCPHADVVEALVKAYPDALTLEEEKGWYPLHYACRFKAPKAVVQLLVEFSPEKGMESVKKLDRQGRAPLYYAVRYDAPPGVVGVLLNVDASVVLEEDQNSDSPLALIWDDWAEKSEGKRTLQRFYVPESEAANMTQCQKAAYVSKRLHTQSKVLARWKRVEELLKAAFGFPSDVDDDSSIDNTEGCHKKANVPEGRTWRMLHATAAIKCHPSMFQLALALYPEQAEQFDEFDLEGPDNIQGGWKSAPHLSPLHLAAASLASGDSGKAVIQQLLEANPEAAKIADKLGGLPLHHIVDNRAKSHWQRDGASEIFHAFEQAVRTMDRDGRMPLHRAATAIVSHGDTTDEATMARSPICNLLKLHPEAAVQADFFGRTPLHLAVEQATSWDIQLQQLYEANQQAVQTRTGIKLGNRLPLHFAAANPHASVCLIRTLVSLHPRGATQSDRRGKMPLHYACEAGLPWEAVKAIHEANPQAVLEPENNSRGWNALQMAAASKNSDNELLSELASLNRNSAHAVDTTGRMALHLACKSGKKWDTGLSTLFDANPEALAVADSMGLLPFHILAFRYCGDSDASVSALPSHHRRHSSRAAMELTQREQAREAEKASEVTVLFNLLMAEPSILADYAR